MLNKIKLALGALALGAIVVSYMTIGHLRSEVTRLNGEVDRHSNNAITYEAMYNQEAESGRVLRLKAEDLQFSNNKLIRKMDSIANANKIKPGKSGGIGVGSTTVIRDTAYVIIDNTVDFKLDTTVVHNKYTKIGVRIDGDSLITTPDINNFMSLFVYPSKEYKNEYSSWFRRLIKFDWKKTIVTRYRIENENDLINTTETVVYVIED